MDINRQRVAHRAIVRAVLLIAMASFAVAPTAAASDDLADLELESLMHLEITSVSRKQERLARTPAAVYVVQGDDLRAFGVTQIPDALRMVPGMTVARMDGSRWAISARGFNDRFAGRLLVMVDGRSVYTPLYGGVYWEHLDVPIDDIERIEVVRGPGGTLWGANAVNGIINIITKDAADTQGSQVEISAGNFENYFARYRFGGSVGDDLSYRAWGKYVDRDRLFDANGDSAHDASKLASGGFRFDWQPSSMDTVSVMGGAVDGKFEGAIDGLNFDTVGSNYHLLGRWTRRPTEGQEFSLQAYYDQTLHNELVFHERRHIFDLDFQHRFQLAEWNDLVWGTGYRLSSDHIGGTQLIISPFGFDPDERRDHLFSAFVQDEIRIIEDHLWLTVGSKFEKNNFSGFEYQPSARLLWMPSEQQSLWAAITRSVRTPTRVDENLLSGSLVGNPDIDAEIIVSHEFGYRAFIAQTLSLDVALHYSKYRRLITQEANGNSGSTWDTKGNGNIWGAEVTADWRVLERWRVAASYTWLAQRTSLDGTAFAAQFANIRARTDDDAGQIPSHQVQLRSVVQLPWNLELSAASYWVGNLKTTRNNGFDEANSYVRLDARIGWRPRSDLELSLVGQNLTASRHFEFSNHSLNLVSQIPRIYYAKIRWTR